jgi:ERCC4-type nuclease
MSIELIIDNREKYLIPELKKISNLDFLVEQLDLGDILFRRGGETILIIERKTVDDLKASICDGRSREQKARLLGSGTPTNRIMYLIEGDMNRSNISGIPNSTLLSNIINTQLRDDIKIYKTFNIIETAVYILKLFDKLNNDTGDYFKEGLQKVKYATTLKKSKKANMTPEIWFTCQLSQIPQVTEKVADVIIFKYPSLIILLQEYQNTPNHLKEKLLSDINFPLATGKTRRIGDKISGRIYRFIHGITEDET